MDCDSEAVDFAKKRLAVFCQKHACPTNAFKLVKANFANLKSVWQSQGIARPAGILFDLGTSHHQLQSKGRGFSFQKDELLDMRMDENLKVSAADLIAALGQKELYELFSKLGEEKYSLAIARAINRTRREKPIETTGQLAKIVEKVYCQQKGRRKIHPATKIFQALRIAVNDELNNLRKALPEALEILEKKGKLVVISFHGLEDKIVKKFFKEKDREALFQVLTKKPIVPDDRELKVNPRARSAKLRAIKKL